MTLQSFVSIIGSGNLSWHLAPALDNAGFAVKEVYSRDAKRARKLTERLYQAEVKRDLDFSQSRSRIFIIAVSDDAIHEIAQEIVLPDDSVLAHTSGGQPMSVLDFAAISNIGVFYPLQTFSKDRKADFKEIPIFVESQTAEAGQILSAIGRAISRKVYTIDSGNRKTLHVAAVFASNFTNHMLTISKQIMHSKNLDYDWLKPLIAETLNKSLMMGPEKAQTGPAKRGDLQTLESHLEYLQDSEQLVELYKVISQHIIDSHSG